jgi:hypothetical protein
VLYSKERKKLKGGEKSQKRRRKRNKMSHVKRRQLRRNIIAMNHLILVKLVKKMKSWKSQKLRSQNKTLKKISNIMERWVSKISMILTNLSKCLMILYLVV